MAIKLSGESRFAGPVSNLNGEHPRPRLVTAFGTSMQPFIKPGAELKLESFKTASVRLGDIVTFQSQSGALVTHRVVKILREQADRTLLTKGDNRLMPDPAVSGHQIFGRVTQVDKINIRSLRHRLLGRVVAQVSYGQFAIYQALAKSPFNRFVCWLQKKGWCPKISPGPWLLKRISPISWVAWYQSIVSRYRIERLNRQLYRQNITIEPWSIRESEQMVQVWNEVFPDYSTNAQRLNQMVFEGRGFYSSRFFLIKKAGRLLGWVLARLDPKDSPAQTGSIDVFALTEEGWRLHLDQVLFQKVLTWFKAHHTQQIILNSHPIPENPFGGVLLTPLSIASSAFGFEPAEVSTVLTVPHASYRSPDTQKFSEELVIRPWRATDDGAVRDFFRRNGRADMGLFYDEQHAHSKDKMDILVATLGNSILGFCRCLPDDELRDYSDVAWIWVLSQPDRRRGYFLRLLVDSNARSQGIGTALAAHAFESLWKRGAQEIALVVTQDKILQHFYERFGFCKAGCFLKSKRADKI